MKKELDEKMRAVEESWIDDYNLPAEFPQSTNDAAKECTSGEPGTSEKFYNDVYFDSDEDTGDGAKVKKRVISDAELLYDPHADDKDQMWVDKQRTRGKILVKKAGSPNKSKKLDNAQLSCPACLTTVCLDCQSIICMIINSVPCLS
uniref:E2F-associated phosphoprotein n=1 Tax=Ciona savignyi TaxID=51511 RepID=H2YRR0_CIOSA